MDFLGARCDFIIFISRFLAEMIEWLLLPSFEITPYYATRQTAR